MYRISLIVLLLTVAGCGPSTDPTRGPVSEDEPLRVVATTSMIADVVRVVGGPTVDVTGLMGPGIDPHLYKASEGDVARMSNADIVFYNGLHLEGKMVEIFAQMAERGKDVHAVTEGIAPGKYRESELFAGNYDPHVWFDLSLWQDVTRYVGDRLADRDSVHAAQYRRRAAAYADTIAALHTWTAAKMDGIDPSLRVLITSHDAFGYFGRAYGVEVRGLQGISTASEAGTADVQELAEFVADRRIPSMFVESSISPRGIEAVRAAVRDKGFDVQIGGTLYGDALGPAGSGADTYLGMMRANIATITAGLQHGN